MKCLFLVALGCCFLAPASAGAADADPYPKLIPTISTIAPSAKVELGKNVMLRGKVRSNGTVDAKPVSDRGTLARTQVSRKAAQPKPEGKARIRVISPAGATIFDRTVPYHGRPVHLTGPRIDSVKKYRLTIDFTPKKDSRFLPSSGRYVMHKNDFDVDGANDHDGDHNGDHNGDGDHNGEGNNGEGNNGEGNSGDGNGLPNTGGPDRGWLFAALGLVVAGGSLTTYGRRRVTKR